MLIACARAQEINVLPPASLSQTNQHSPQEYLSIFPQASHKTLSPHTSPFTYVNLKAPKGGKIIFGEVGSFDTFYPFFLKGQPAAGTQLLYATLFKHDHDSSVGMSYPYAASSVEIKGQEVIFHLREGMTFQDGNPITSQDIAFSFHFMTKHSPFQEAYYRGVQGVRTSGDFIVIFTLKPDAAKETAFILSDLPILSKKFFDTHNVEKNPFTIPVGSGPYRISQFKAGNSVQYERVPQWWGKDLPVNIGFYNFDKIVYEYYKDSTVMREALAKNDIDFLVNTKNQDWQYGYSHFPAFQQGKIVKDEISHKGPVGHVALIFNTENPLFKDHRVRQALTMLLDFDEMNQLFFSKNYKRTTSIFPNTKAQASGKPSSEELAVLQSLAMGFSLPTEKDPFFHARKDSSVSQSDDLAKDSRQAETPIEAKGISNINGLDASVFYTPVENFTITTGSKVERAKKALALLLEAGWILKNGVLTHPEKGPFQFTILSDQPTYDKVFQRFQDALKGVGITLHVKFVDAPYYHDLLHKKQYDMVLGSLASSGETPGNELIGALHSSSAHIKGSHNLAGIQNPAVDEMIKKIIASASYEELMKNSRVLDRIVMSGHYGIPLWYSDKLRIAYWKNKFDHPEHSSRGPEVLTWWSKP